jgi:hypothetical protein
MTTQRFRVVVAFEYDVEMDDAEGSYGTVIPWEMALVDRENYESPKMLIGELGSGKYKVAVTPVEAEMEPQLIRHREVLLRDAARWQRSYLARNPECGTVELIEVLEKSAKV